MSLWLSGIGVTRGIVIGRVHKVQGSDLEIPEYQIKSGETEQEIQRFQEAREETRQHLRQVREHIPVSVRADITAFIDTHLLMLDDAALSLAVEEIIRERLCNAEWALKLQRDNLVAVFEQMDDDYLKSRRDDVEHVVASIQRVMLRKERPLAPTSKDTNSEVPPVIVSDDLTPAEIILLNQQGVGGVITEFGGPLSHTAILTKSLGLPAIVGMHHARRLLRDDEPVVLDGETGHALASPHKGALAYYRQRQQHNIEYQQMLGLLKDSPAVSRDGQKITLLSNIEMPGDTAQATDAGAEGVGLYRTEFLYMNRAEPPTETEQYEAYREVLEAVDGPVTIRTLDLGADKNTESQKHGNTATNPALGLRAVRYCLKERDLFRVQLRALLRASVHGEVLIMLPMISNLQELKQSRHLIEEVMDELKRDGHSFNPDVPIGAMIEVPAAALSGALLATHADFFSIGTNDLIQYTLAIDRVDDEVNYLYDPLHPAVLKLIAMTIESGRNAGIAVAMCGEMASEPRYTRLLLGLGLTEFSMHPASLLEVKRIIMHSDIGALQNTVSDILSSSNPAEVRELIEQLAVPENH